MKLRPLNDFALIERLVAASQTSGGIIIPDAAKERPVEGKVISIGPGRYDERGMRIVPDVKPGERVLFSKYSGTEVELDGAKLTMLHETDILGVLSDE